MKIAATCVIMGTFLLSCPARPSERPNQVIHGSGFRSTRENERERRADCAYAQYVSVKIQAAHVSYKSGFLENIKQIVCHFQCVVRP